MKLVKYLFVLIISLLIVSCDFNKPIIISKTRLPLNTVSQTSYYPYNAKFSITTLILKESRDKVWEAFSNEFELNKWYSPNVNLDFRIGGSISVINDETSIFPGDTFTWSILSFYPTKLITYKVNLNDQFSEKCRKQDSNLQLIVILDNIEEDEVQIQLVMLGWGEGREWDKTYKMFEQYNKKSLENLLKYFQEGPVYNKDLKPKKDTVQIITTNT